MNHMPITPKAPLKMRYAFMIAIIFPVLTGCGIGYNTMLVATRTNMGVDIDTKPPTLEISIARQEGVIEPQFEEGKTLPVMTSFKSDTNAIGRMFVGVGQSFSTGKAAYIMTKLYGERDADITQIQYDPIFLSQPPKRSRFWSFLPCVSDSAVVDPNFLEPGEVRPLAFGTQSMLGLKVDWNTTTGQYPSALKFGYNRKELALIPVTLKYKPGNEDKIKRLEDLTKMVNKAKAQKEEVKEYLDLIKQMIEERVITVDTASLLATVDSSFSSQADKEFSYLQYFATGDAATNLALRQQVRRVMLEKLNPNIENVEIDTSDPLSLAAQQKYNAILSIYGVLIMPESGEKANDMAKQLDALVNGIKIPKKAKNLQQYNPDDKKFERHPVAMDGFNNKERRGFERIASLESGLNTSIKALEKYKSDSAEIAPQKALHKKILDMVFASPVVTQLINF